MIKLPKKETLELKLENAWLTIKLNRPESRNALSKKLIEDLSDVLNGISNNLSIRGITFRGKGGVFCAGADIKELKTIFSEGKTKKEISNYSMEVGRFFALISNLPQITLMVVEGAAIAGGFGLACTGDFVIAHKDARFSLAETKIGLTPAQISPYVIQRLGFFKGRQLMLTAAQINGTEAAKIGLADFVGDNKDELDILEQRLIKQVLSCAPGALAETKRLISAIPYTPKKEMVTIAAESFANCFLSDEGYEGISSFLEKRQPSWAK